MPLLFLGFLLVSVVWLLWAVWMVVWAIALLFWPVALLLGGVVLWRSQMRRWQRATVEGSPAPIRNGAGQSIDVVGSGCGTGLHRA
jgi:hypothetical protein